MLAAALLARAADVSSSSLFIVSPVLLQLTLCVSLLLLKLTNLLLQLMYQIMSTSSNIIVTIFCCCMLGLLRLSCPRQLRSALLDVVSHPHFICAIAGMPGCG
jgi:hypothetical protein